MRNNSLKLLVGAALAAGTGLAIAQISPPPPSTSPSTGSPSTGSPSASPSAGGAAGASGETFTKLDSDKDGMVSKKEASKNKGLTGKWDTLDTNKDGKLDQGEFAAFEADSSSGSGSTPKY